MNTEHRALPSKRADALAAGTVRYFTGRPCVRGHIAERFAKSGKCVECCAEQVRAWRAENPEVLAESKRKSDKKHREKNPALTAERNATYGRRWRESNAERMKELRDAWDKKNPEKVRAKTRNRRARVKGAVGYHTAEDIAAILADQNGMCAICNIDISSDHLREVDHIVPLSKGGSNGPENLQITCRPCNRRKAASMPSPHSGDTQYNYGG